MSSTHSRNWRSPKPAAAPPETSANQAGARKPLLGIAQHSNLAADYQAYLNAFPGGVFAQMAKNRIASMETARTSAPPAPPQTLAITEPTGPKVDMARDKVGTVDTERALNLSPAEEKEVQLRLAVLDLYKAQRLARWIRRPGLRSANGRRSVACADIIPRFRATGGVEGGCRREATLLLPFRRAQTGSPDPARRSLGRRRDQAR